MTIKHPALSQVHEQCASDQSRLNEIEIEHEKTRHLLDMAVEAGHWHLAAEHATQLWNLEGWRDLITARLQINREWLDNIHPGQPITDYDG